MVSAQQANVEYFFRILYDLFGQRGAVNFAAFSAFLAHVWLVIIFIGYVLSIIAFLVIIYSLVKMFELRHAEEKYYSTLLIEPDAGSRNPRWEHIKKLMEGESPSEWREAIIEADIMLDDMLSRQGYIGESVGEKLKLVEPADFNTLEEAWEAHKVRNQIAHQGSAFDLSESLANRTIQRYEAVFREFGLA